MTQEVNPTVVELLGELESLSERHGYSWHAEYMREAITAFENSPTKGWDHLISIQFWGGPGSITDVSFSPEEISWHEQNGRAVPEYLRTLSAKALRADRRRYAELLCEMSEHIQATAPATEANARWRERAIWFGKAYREFLRNGSI